MKPQKHISRRATCLQSYVGLPCRLATLALFILLAPPSLGAAEIDGKKLTTLDQFLETQQRERGIPGLSAAVAVWNKVVWSKGYGEADIENHVPVTPDTVFRIGDVSTLITAVGVLKFVQEGKLSLNTDIRKFVPEFPNKGAAITVHHLLAQQSGIRDKRNANGYYNTKNYAKMIATIDSFRTSPLAAQPGEAIQYGHRGFTLLGLALERVSSMTFSEYLDKHVCTPLQMNATTVDDKYKIIPRRARGYYRAHDGNLRNARPADMSNRFPGAGLVSTANDMGLFAASLMSNSLLDPVMLEMMTTDYKTDDGKSTQYGLGCFVRSHKGRILFGHAGRVPQASAILVFAKTEKVAFVLLTNLEQADVKALGLEALDILLPSLKHPVSAMEDGK